MPNRFVRILFLIFSPLVYGDDIAYKKFNHITVEDGLSQAQVASIVKDSRGYYWFGTINGLNRYDGYEMTVYRPGHGRSDDVPKGTIFQMVEDARGMLWILHLGRLTRYDPFKDRFTMIRAEEQFFTELVLFELDGDQLWLNSANKHLGRFNTLTGAFELVLEGLEYFGRIFSTEGALWLGINGLHRYDKKTGELKDYGLVREPIATARNLGVWDIVKYKDYLWVGTRSGIVPFNIKQGRFENDRRQLSGIYISKMVVSDDGDLWVATRGHHLFRYQIDTGKIDKFVANRSDPYALQEDYQYTLLLNEDGLWVGSLSGVSHMRVDSSVGFMRKSNSIILDDGVYAVEIDPKKEGLWVASTDGIARIGMGKDKHYKIGSIYTINFSGSAMWVSGGGGLFKYDGENDRFIDFTDQIPGGYRFKPDISNFFGVGTQRFLFLTRHNYQLNYWDMQNNEYYELRRKGIHKEDESFYKMKFFTKVDDDILIGTERGIYTVDLEERAIKEYLLQPSSSLLQQASINGIYQNVDELWVASSEGVFRIKDGGIIAHYTTDDGLPDNLVRGLFFVQGIVWVTTDIGLSAFSFDKDLKFKKIFLNHADFNVEYYSGGVYHCENDRCRMYLASTQGLVVFDPKEFIVDRKPPGVTITDFQLFNQTITAGSKLLPQVINETDRLTLSHKQNMLTFEFSSMNIQEKNHLYAYQLEGFAEKDNWVTTGANNRRATFTPGPGEYTFRVKSGWDQHTWSDQVAELRVVVLPPWWQTVWAYTIYIALVLFSIIAFIRFRTIALSKRANELQTLVQEKTAQLSSSNEQLKQSNQQVETLLEHKNQLFANTSHELRTPLTLILGPIGELLKSKKGKERQVLEMVKRNAERLSHMVEQMLTLARLDMPEHEKMLPSNLSETLDLILNSVQPLLDQQSINLKVDRQDNIIIPALPDALNVITLNLLSNAIKYTDKGGQITVSLKREQGQAVLRVKDTGIGIAQSEQKKVFEKFTRLKQAQQYNIPGSGIGLALVNELVKLHQGNIRLQSEPGVGSEFIVSLPMQCDQEKLNSDITQARATEVYSDHWIDQQSMAAIVVSDEDAINNPLQTKPKLLIVDDTVDMLAYLKQLTEANYHSITVNNGQDALELAEQESPDLILCDVMMPGLDGFEVLQSIRNNIQTCHIPVILLTAKGDKDSRLHGFQQQVDDYIAKPFDADELLARTNNLIKSRETLKQQLTKALKQNTAIQDFNNEGLIKKDQVFLKDFHALIQENYTQHEYSVIDLSTALNMSESSLQKKLKAITGNSPIAYLNKYRLQQACYYLRETDLPVQDIVGKVGFMDGSNFTRSFKKQYGKTPREYRA